MKSQQLQEFCFRQVNWNWSRKKLAETQKEYENAVVVRNREREIYGHLEQTFLDAQAGLLAKHLKEGRDARSAVPIIIQNLSSTYR